MFEFANICAYECNQVNIGTITHYPEHTEHAAWGGGGGGMKQIKTLLRNSLIEGRLSQLVMVANESPEKLIENYLMLSLILFEIIDLEEDIKKELSNNFTYCNGLELCFLLFCFHLMYVCYNNFTKV